MTRHCSIASSIRTAALALTVTLVIIAGTSTPADAGEYMVCRSGSRTPGTLQRIGPSHFHFLSAGGEIIAAPRHDAHCLSNELLGANAPEGEWLEFESVRIPGPILAYDREHGVIVHLPRGKPKVTLVSPQAALSSVAITSRAPEITLSLSFGKRVSRQVKKLARRKQFDTALALGTVFQELISDKEQIFRMKTLLAKVEETRLDFLQARFRLIDVKKTHAVFGGEQKPSEVITYSLLTKAETLDGLKLEIWAQTEDGTVFHSTLDCPTERKTRKHDHGVRIDAQEVATHGRIVRYRLELAHDDISLAVSEHGDVNDSWWKQAADRHFGAWDLEQHRP